MLRYGVEMRDKAIWYLSQGRTELVGLHSQDRISSLFRISHQLPYQKASVTQELFGTSLLAKLHLAFRSLEG